MTNKTNLNQIASLDKETVVVEYKNDLTKRPTYYQSEEQLENDFIKQLVSQGYEYLKEVKDETSLIKNLKEQIERLNDYKFSDNEWNQFFNLWLANKQDSVIEKTNKIQRDYIFNLTCDNGETKNIYLLDKNNIYRNKLQVINQYQNESGKYKNRYDVTILVNGIPMIHIELKKRGVILKEAFNQINRYKHESFSTESGLFDFIQIFVISNGTQTKYYANTVRYAHVNNQKIKSKTSNSYEFTNYWSDSKNKIINDVEDFTKTFFAQHTILNVLIKYCIFTTENNLLVMRPYQIVATEKILNKINISYNYHNKLGSIEAGGYVWHSTGSGKTITSFKTAQLASMLNYIDKVLFVVDRKDLDYQTMKEYDRFQKGAANSNKSTTILQAQLEETNNDKKIIITTIQKLSIFIKKNPRHPIFKKHVVIIFDECHRSQFGDMHAAITSNFKKYNIFGFTGTPIFAKNATIGINHNAKYLNEQKLFKTTEQLFGEKLHTYTIIDAINDGNVLPFKYTEVQTFKQKDNIKDTKVQAIDKDGVWKHPKRIEEVSKYILDHFKQYTYQYETYTYSKVVDTIKQKKVETNVRGFNSIFAVSSIEMAKLYYTELKKQLKERNDINLKIATIFSFSPNETIDDIDDNLDDEDNESVEGLDQSSREFLDNAIKDYNLMFNTNYDSNGEKFQNYYRDVSMRLKNKELDMLIVVNMFLTGFDATTLNTLWVDKYLKMHGLIQAFSRTNRILNSIKKFGNIISLRPLEKELKEAIALFGDKQAAGIILIKKISDYYEGYTNSHGVFEPGYKQLVNNLLEKFPLNNIPRGEKDKKEFIRMFGRILQVRNILVVFDEFKEKEIFSERDFQDYLGLYNDMYQEFKEKAKAEKIDITPDLVFEIELVKQIDINIDYIFEKIKEFHDKNIKNHEVITMISKLINSSYELRSKKELILEFLESLYSNEVINIDSIDEIINIYNEFKKVQMDKEVEQIIKELNLDEIKTKKFINDCFKTGELKTIGTNIDEILPKVSRFNKNNDGNNRYEIKLKVIEKLQYYFDKFFGI